MIRLVVSDLDGTLLNIGSTLSDKTIEVIQACQAQGIHFVPATSRGLTSVPKEVYDLATRYLILSNGAIIYDKETKSNLYDNLLSFNTLDCVIEQLEDIDYVLSLAQNTIVYTEEKLQEMLALGYPKEDYDRKIKFKDKQDLKNNLDHNVGIEKIHLNFPEESERLRALHILSKMEEWNVCSSWVDNIEITSLGVDKGSAIKMLEEKMSLSQEEVMCFGDGQNDISMLSHRTYGVAMLNASAEVKKVANYITSLSHDKNGLAIHIEDTILKTDCNEEPQK